MNKRPNRTTWGRLSTLLITTMFAMVLMSWSSSVVAEPPAELVWRLEAEPIGSSVSDFRDIRLVSPTTYVRAEHATIDGTQLHARNATIFANGWRLVAADLSIDLRLDKVEITTLRTDAPAE